MTPESRVLAALSVDAVLGQSRLFRRTKQGYKRGLRAVQVLIDLRLIERYATSQAGIVYRRVA